jgi:hypothetical protein
MSMKKFLILYEAPPSVIDEWKKTPEAHLPKCNRKAQVKKSDRFLIAPA